MRREPRRRPTFTKSSISGSLSSPLAVAASVMPSGPGTTVPGWGGATSAAPGPALCVPAPAQRGLSGERRVSLFLFLFLIYFSSRGRRRLSDRCPGRSHEKERSQEGTGSNGERWIQGWQQVTGATSAGLRGGVTGSAPVSDLGVAANAPKIAGGRGAGSARAGQEGHPFSKRGLVSGLSPAEPLRRARGGPTGSRTAIKA